MHSLLGPHPLPGAIRLLLVLTSQASRGSTRVDVGEGRHFWEGAYPHLTLHLLNPPPAGDQGEQFWRLLLSRGMG